MKVPDRVRAASNRGRRGFTLTEMLVTMLIMTLASTLLATGIPVAIDTYQKTVNSANAQIALSTTLTVLRSEYGASTDLEEVDGVLYYRSDEGVYATISKPESDDGDEPRGLVKKFYVKNEGVFQPIADGDGDGQLAYPLISDAAVTKPLHVEVGPVEWNRGEQQVVVKNLRVVDESTHKNALAQVDEYRILAPFAK